VQKNKRNIFSVGFTIVEVVVSISIAAMLMLAVAYFVVLVSQNPTAEITSLSSIEQAKKVTATFANELRGAVTGNDGAYPINQTLPQLIVFYSNYGTSGNIVNRIRYYFSDETLWKGVTVPTGSPLQYDLDSEVVKPVMTNLFNDADPLFYYYGDDYNGINSPDAPSIVGIRFVKINLMVKNQITATNVNVFPISAGATIRNLKDNLGD